MLARSKATFFSYDAVIEACHSNLGSSALTYRAPTTTTHVMETQSFAPPHNCSPEVSRNRSSCPQLFLTRTLDGRENTLVELLSLQTVQSAAA